MRILMVLFFIRFLTGSALMAEEVTKTKTFDNDRLVDYTFEYQQGEEVYRLFYSFERPADLVSIKFSPERRFSRFKDLRPILHKLVQAAEAHDQGKIDHFMCFEYLDCDDLYKRAILAFHDQKPWEEYVVTLKKKWVAPPYEFIVGHIINEGIFSELISLFSELGYEARFSSYEKLGVRKAGDFDFYDGLKEKGIQPGDKFPVPMMLHFTLKQ
ncbi:MAG: hypothetical protein JW932_05325 [Deltaproteobacteria bacterium]|nr:hypothetical protein [Deltaproteobacteria bacterium]